MLAWLNSWSAMSHKPQTTNLMPQRWNCTAEMLTITFSCTMLYEGLGKGINHKDAARRQYLPVFRIKIRQFFIIASEIHWRQYGDTLAKSRQYLAVLGSTLAVPGSTCHYLAVLWYVWQWITPWSSLGWWCSTVFGKMLWYGEYHVPKAKYTRIILFF